MKANIIHLLLFGAIAMGTPGMAWAAQTAPGQAAAQAPAAAKAAGPLVPGLNASEKSDLALLGSARPGLAQQRAGDRVYIEDDGGRHWRRGYTYGLGGLILIVVIVTVIVIVLG